MHDGRVLQKAPEKTKVVILIRRTLRCLPFLPLSLPFHFCRSTGVLQEIRRDITRKVGFAAGRRRVTRMSPGRQFKQKVTKVVKILPLEPESCFSPGASPYRIAK